MFSYAFWPFVYLLWRTVYLSPLSMFLIGLLCWVVRVLYILWIYSTLWAMWFANIFSQLVGYLFILLMMFLKHKSWNSKYLYFLCSLLLLVSYRRNHSQTQGHKDLLLSFLLRVLQFYPLHASLWSIWLNFYI